MSNINYNHNADLQIDRYDKAIKNINLAIEKLEEGIEELKAIVGFQDADDLKKDLRDKISYLREKITDINSAIDKIDEGIEELKEIVGFQEAEDLQQSLRDKRSYLRGKVTEITNEKTRIYKRSRELQREQDRKNEEKG